MSTAKPKLERKPKAKGTAQGAATTTRQVIRAEVAEAMRGGDFLRENNAKQLLCVLIRTMEGSSRGRTVIRKLREATDEQKKINKMMIVQTFLDAIRLQPSEGEDEGTAEPQSTAAVVSIQEQDGSWRNGNKNKDAKFTMARQTASKVHGGSSSDTEDEDLRA